MTFLIGILAGFGMALMSAVNNGLRQHLGVPFLTACVSFFVGLLVIVMVLVCLGDFLIIDVAHAPFWVWTGGFLGMMSLSAVVLIFPKLGAIQTAIMPIVGQVFMGVMIDTFGWLNAKQIALSPSRMVGILLVLIGVFVVVVLPNATSLNHKNDATQRWLWRGVGVVGGVCMAMQTAINGELGRLLSSPLNATFVSFLGGTLGLIVVVSWFEKSWGRLNQPMAGKPFWIWLGGVLSALFICANVWLVPQIGTGAVVTLMLTGSVMGSLLVDKFGLFYAPKKQVYGVQMGGVALLLLGVACIRLLA